MAARLFPGPLVRTIFNHDLIHSKQPLALRPPMLLHHPAFTQKFHPPRHKQQQQQQQHRQSHYSHGHDGRCKGQPRLMIASGLGIALFGAASDSFDSDHQQYFGETNFDTIRPLHTRQPSARLTLPSFTCSPVFDSTTLENFTSLDDVDDDQISDWTGERPSKLPGSLASAPAPFPHPRPIIPFTSTASSEHAHDQPEGHLHRQNAKKSRPNHPIRHYASQSTLAYPRPRVSATLPPPTHSFSSTCSSSTSSASTSSSSSSASADEGELFISPQYPLSRQSTSFPTPLRNCQSLHFTKQKTIHQSRHPAQPRSKYTQSPSLTSPQLDHSSSHHPVVPLSSSASELSAFHEHHTTPCPPELLAFPLQNPTTSPPTKFTHLVKSKIQRTRRSFSHSRSSSTQSSDKHLSSNLSPSCSILLPSHSSQAQLADTDRSSARASCSRYISFSATCEELQTLPRTSFPPLSMQSGTDQEGESIHNRRDVPISASPLRSASSQPFMAEQYRKTSISGGRSQSVIGQRPVHLMPRRAGSSMGSIPVLHSAHVPSSREPAAAKPLNFTGGNSPPRKSMRTQLSRLAQLLTPSPTIKYSPVISSKVKIPSPPSDPKPCTSTNLWAPIPPESGSRQSSAKVFNVPQPINPCHKPNATPMSIINWRTAISDREYRHILETWGSTEVHRQQLIWELCQTETAFLDSLNVVLDLFISPLMDESQDGRWVDGVPKTVQELFTDLDQIAHFHSEIVMAMSYNRMCEKKRHKAPVVIKFADTMSAFVPRLRIYERYLVCFERVSQQIDRLSLDPADQFGSFVRMQSHAAGFGAMSLTSYLLKPIQRLMKYPLFFRQLCETTPTGHPDHQSTSNLWKATDGIIRSMQDVKGLEDEHEALKALEEQLVGLPEGLVLANRRRKIVTRGTLQMVYPSHKDLIKLSPTSANPESETSSEMKPGCRRMSTASHVSTSIGFYTDFRHKISTQGIIRSLSPVSDSSETSETTHSRSSFHSMNTDTTFDATSSPQPLALEVFRQEPSTSGCSAQITPRFEMGIEPFKAKAPRSLQSKRSSNKLTKGRGVHTENIEVILLTDMLILCMRETPPKKNWRIPSRKPEDLNRFRILDGIGLSRLHSVEDLGGQLGDFEDLLRLGLKPLTGMLRGESGARKPTLGTVQDESGQASTNESTVYLSSTPVANSSTLIWGSSSSTATTTPNISTILAAEKEWKNWVKEFRKLEVLTHYALLRQLKHAEQKRRRSSVTGKIDLSIKKSSSMSTLL
ncbi:hypothetical protein PCASD_15900 [Puccinia coronata f. sp. avenae]|uniref:DH domain-containing protein n=1 Tax=Puccinia coronata f. sp. avenae TaxID=200324 RepID=A0A2N5TA19_9BASI|nr:hypothetical protein PCASD_15900 [Puccinia coronata f. sp. avenae]